MMKKLTLALLFFSTYALGQLSISVVEGDLIVDHHGLDLKYFPIGEFKPLNWQVGSAYYPDGNARSYDGIRFNLPQERAEVNANGNILPLLPGVVTGVSMGKDNQINHIFINVPQENPVFMELLSPGKADLLVYRRVDNDEPPDIEGSVNTFVFEREVKEVKYVEFLYVWYQSKIEQLKPKKKYILDIMQDHSMEVEIFMEENKTRLKNPQEVMLLFNYYNSFEL